MAFDPASLSVVVQDKSRAGVETVSGVPRGATSRATAMVFEDPLSLQMKEDILRVAPSDATVLVIGETGTGKELVARYIHAHSKRKSGPFLAVNCGGFSETLIEAELFGHEKGAFTGALKTEMGWFEAANGGTLLLDEIGDLPLPMQVKLLRVLQEREIVRVGSRRPRPIDVRLIAATNVNLDAAVQAKTFRNDLFYRLNVAMVQLPPLRARKGDIKPLADYFLKLYGEKLGRRDPELTPVALQKLLNYNWPGNIRELENVLHNALLLTNGSLVQHLPIVESPAAQFEPSLGFEEQLRQLFEGAFSRGETNLFEFVTRSLVSTALQREGGNQVHAAEKLGLTRNALRTHLAHMGMIAPRKKLRAPTNGKTSSVRDRDINVTRLGYQKFGTLAALKALGSLDARLACLGFRVEWREFNSGPDILDAIGRGEIDFGVTGEAATVFAVAMGVSFFYVGFEPPAPSDVAIVVADRNIRCVDDLKGKKVAFSRWSNADHFLMTALKKRGLSRADIEPIYIPPSLDLLDDLKGGAIHAWGIWEPLLSVARDNDAARILLDGSEHVVNRQFYVARRLFAVGHPQLIEAIFMEIRALGANRANRQPNDLSAIARCLNLDHSAAERHLNRLEFRPQPLDAEIIEEQQAIADAYLSSGQLPARAAIADAVWRGS